MVNHKKISLYIKNLFDKIIALIALLINLPVFLIISIVLKLQREDVFYMQARLGYEGDEFYVYKFTTMPKGSEKLGLITTSNDSRPTKFGKFLRKTKLNELPQLINVLSGDMSFIGPRPIIKSQMEESFSPGEIKEYYQMRPGITGMASLIYHHEDRLLASVDNPRHYYNTYLMPRKKDLEKRYAQNWSLLLDIKILYYTFIILICDSLGIEIDIYSRFRNMIPEEA